MIIAVLAFLMTGAAKSDVQTHGVAECTSPGTASPATSHLIIENRHGVDDLDYLRVEGRNGRFLHVYYDDASEREARGYARCLGLQVDLIAEAVGDTRMHVQWSSVAFVADDQYIPPRGEETTVRWVVHTSASEAATYSTEMEQMVLLTLPHEQAHAYQARGRTSLPLWFSEGHASWIERKISEKIAPEIALQARRRMVEDAADAPPANLADWGHRKVKREAIMRQVSEEDRARMEADLAYIPKGTYRFALDDFESDESNSAARYLKARLVFEGLEQRHGAQAVHRWVDEILSRTQATTFETLTVTVAAHFGEDLTTLLSDEAAIYARQ